jgi:hypothetical protein
MPGHATLTVVRRPAHVNRLRAYKIYVDDVPVGFVKNGKSLSLPLSEGVHEAVAKIDWIRSIPFRFECIADQPICLRCETSTDPLEMLKAVVGRPSRHLAFNVRSSPSLSPATSRGPGRPVASALKSAAWWFFSCVLFGFVIAMMLDTDVVPQAISAKRSEAIGQASGIVGVLGAFLIYLRRVNAK